MGYFIKFRGYFVDKDNSYIVIVKIIEYPICIFFFNFWFWLVSILFFNTCNGFQKLISNI